MVISGDLIFWRNENRIWLWVSISIGFGKESYLCQSRVKFFSIFSQSSKGVELGIILFNHFVADTTKSINNRGLHPRLLMFSHFVAISREPLKLLHSPMIVKLTKRADSAKSIINPKNKHAVSHYFSVALIISIFQYLL